MRHILQSTALLAMVVFIHPALGQISPGASGVGGGLGTGMGAATPTPRPVVPDIAPPALPGAGNIQGIATAPKLKKANTGDPTTDLFTAINSGNYADAQDAISRGADLTAHNPLGETPLDLAIALNQNSITFMILSARNEGDAGPSVQATSQAKAVGHKPPAKLHAIPAKAVEMNAPAPVPAPRAKPVPVATGGAGQPNVSVGFLGFSQK
jgi:hypothetical protein